MKKAKRDPMVKLRPRRPTRTRAKVKALVIPTPAEYWSDARELADAAEEYVSHFLSVAESPRLNAARHRLQSLIAEVRGEK